MPGMFGDIIGGPSWLDWRQLGGGYAQSPSGPGPYAPQMQRPVRDLQPYAGPQPATDMGYYVSSPSGPRGASMRAESSMEDYRRPYRRPTQTREQPIDMAAPLPPTTQPPQPQQQSPTSWMDQLQKMLQGATTGIDTARTGIQGMFGQQQPRTIQTTDPGAGYGMSPSGPTAQMPARQPQVQRQVPDLQEAPGYTINRTPWRGAGSDSPTSPYAKAPTYADRYSVQTDPRRLASGAAIRGADYGRSPSNPNWQPARTPKPMSPLYEGPPLSSPSNPNWRPPGG